LGGGWHILWWFGVCGTKWNLRSCASETSHPCKSTRVASGQGCGSTATRQETVVSKRRHHPHWSAVVVFAIIAE
jgi:hypothetical protein